MSNPVVTVLHAKWRMIDHIVRQIRSYLWIHLAAGLFTLLLVVSGGGTFFRMLFTFLLRQEPFGPPLMERLVGVVLLAFFSMLIFSNLIITLTTTYISKETEFLFAFPMRYRSLFVVKLIESIVYSSWAFVVLSVPFFVAYGLAKNAQPAFYPLALAAAVPFLVIPAALGAVLTMLLSAFLPARKARVYSVALLAAALGTTALLVKLMGLRSMLSSTNIEDFSQIMAFLNVGSVPLLPNYWLARAMDAASKGLYRECGYWFLCLLSTAMMTVQLCLWMAPRLYYRGWALAKETASSTYTTGRSIFPLLDRPLAVFSAPIRALISKDLRTFWRDPAQWSQLVILFGLLVIYIANIQGLSRQTRVIDLFFHHWTTILSFFNMSATCFVLSILTTRFVFPMLSLEGKQYWVIGLAPFAKHKLLWEKYGLCLATVIVVALTLTAFSNFMLNLSAFLAGVSLLTVCVLGIGLTSLAVGLSATFPNFKEDNPARIANGLGGTMNIVVSLGYIAANLALEIPAVLKVTAMFETQGLSPSLGQLLWAVWPFLAGLLALNLFVIIWPMRLGLRHWNRLEFHL